MNGGYPQHAIKAPGLPSLSTDCQNGTAFWSNVRHANSHSIGLNCALGATLTRSYIQERNRAAPDAFISCDPNAGLPESMSNMDVDETSDVTSRVIHKFAAEGLINIVGGDTTPSHIAVTGKELDRVRTR